MRCKRCGSFENTVTEYCEICQQDNIEIDKLKKEGHSRHCACRIIFGDGICECNKKGDPKFEDVVKLIKSQQVS